MAGQLDESRGLCTISFVNVFFYCLVLLVLCWYAISLLLLSCSFWCEILFLLINILFLLIGWILVSAGTIFYFCCWWLFGSYWWVPADTHGSCWLLYGSCWLVVYLFFWSALVPTSHVRLLMVMEDGVINHHYFVEEITCWRHLIIVYLML
jgi:hypothetical protein